MLGEGKRSWMGDLRVVSISENEIDENRSIKQIITLLKKKEAVIIFSR